MLDELENTPETTQENANETAQEAVADVKEEIDSRDSAILAELKNIHGAINSQNDHLMKHLESHAPVATPEPVKEEASLVKEDKEPGHTSQGGEAVAMEISEPKDMPKEDKKKSRGKFGKRQK